LSTILHEKNISVFLKTLPESVRDNNVHGNRIEIAPDRFFCKNPVSKGLLMNKSMLFILSFLLPVILCACPAPTARAPEPVIDCGTAYPTRDKPQSKIWYAHDSWWAWLPSGGSGGRLWRRNTEGEWNPQANLDSYLRKLPGRADVRASTNGDTVVAVLVEDSLLAVIRLGWNPKPDRYEPAGKPVRWKASSEVETATIDRRGDGAFWVAYPEDVEAGRRIVARKIEMSAGQSGIGEAIVLAGGLYKDEICAVVALEKGSTGVIWSDQHSEAVLFRTHHFQSPDSAWQAIDTVAVGGKTADDHLNFCCPPAGAGPALLAATKTSLDSVGLPLLCLRVLDSQGLWHSVPFAPLLPEGHPSRPVALWLDSGPVCLYTVYGPQHRLYGMNSVMLQAFSEDGLKTAGTPREVIPPVKELNDVTGPKAAPHGAACLILASDQSGKVYEAFVDQ
jgi:large repetitive protein